MELFTKCIELEDGVVQCIGNEGTIRVFSYCQIPGCGAGVISGHEMTEYVCRFCRKDKQLRDRKIWKSDPPRVDTGKFLLKPRTVYKGTCGCAKKHPNHERRVCGVDLERFVVPSRGWICYDCRHQNKLEYDRLFHKNKTGRVKNPARVAGW